MVMAAYDCNEFVGPLPGGEAPPPATGDGCCNQKRGVSDNGRSWFGNILAAASVAAAGYNAYKAYEIAEQEWRMAKKYWQIAKNWLDYYKDWFASVEDQELSEAMSIDKMELTPDNVLTARGRARVAAYLEYRGLLKSAIRCTSRYCAGLRADMLADLAAAQADAVSMADGLGYRNERAYVEARNDVRFEKMLNTAKRGRDMVADNVALTRNAAGIYGDMFEQTWAGLTGAGQYLGYWSSRNETQYPTSYVQGRADFQRRENSSAQPPQESPVVRNALSDLYIQRVAGGK